MTGLATTFWNIRVLETFNMWEATPSGISFCGTAYDSVPGRFLSPPDYGEPVGHPTTIEEEMEEVYDEMNVVAK